MNDVNEAYTKLAAEILATAVRDYRYMYKYLLIKQKKGTIKESEERRIKHKLEYAESWFSSRYYYVLLKAIDADMDAEHIIPFVRKRVEKEVEDGQ